MEQLLMDQLRAYIADNNPDLLVRLQGERKVTTYLAEKVALVKELLTSLLQEGKPAYLIQELSLEEMTRDLRPSKYHYLFNVLEEEFETAFERLRETGVLTYEIMNLITCCEPVFNRFQFSEENEDNRFLRYAIIGTVKDYLDSQ